jgi:hypothetical protein
VDVVGDDLDTHPHRGRVIHLMRVVVLLNTADGVCWSRS